MLIYVILLLLILQKLFCYYYFIQFFWDEMCRLHGKFVSYVKHVLFFLV